LKSGSRAPIATLTPVPRVSPSKSFKRVEFPFLKPELLQVIISNLTRRHGGNVHDKGIVIITSKWAGDGAKRNAADLTSLSFFNSKNEPGQWVC
jgi:hypothetical protein